MKPIESDKIKADYKQYGFGGYLLKCVKAILRIVHIEINSYYYMVNELDYEKQQTLFNQSGLKNVSDLSLKDFEKGDSSVFSKQKLDIISKRFEDGGYKAYGIIEDDELIYSCWLSLRWLDSHNKCIEGLLAEDECVLIDAYCALKGRGRGIHSAMNSYRLMKAYEMGKRKTISIVLSENTPAYKSQLKTGNKVLFKFFVMNIGKKSFTNYFKKKSKCA